MAASSFRAQAVRGAKAPKPSGKIGSHHKATDSVSRGMAHKVTAPVRIVGKGSMRKGK
jgi:hypothetical protein